MAIFVMPVELTLDMFLTVLISISSPGTKSTTESEIHSAHVTLIPL